MDHTSPNVLFLRVIDNTEKAAKICSTIQNHFAKRERVQIAVASSEIASYVDQLLWRYPEESFLPHSISEQEVKDMIVISCASKNLNSATVLLNLCPKVSPWFAEFATIYDLYDETHPDKLSLSKARMAEYRKVKWTLSVEGEWHVHRS